MKSGLFLVIFYEVKYFGQIYVIQAMNTPVALYGRLIAKVKTDDVAI